VTQSSRSIRAVASIVVGMILVSACGGDDDDSGDAATATTVPAAAAAAAGDTASNESAIQTFVGAVEGTEALVAVTVEGTEVHAYYCDSVSVWGVLDGTAAADALSATDAIGNTLTATLAESTVSGTLTISGTDHAFTASVATGDAGVFFEEIKTGDLVETTAWVRDAAGTVTGAKFTVDLAILGTLPQFTAAEKAVIDQIIATGVVPSVPTGTPPANAQPLRLGPGALGCGLAAFKFVRARTQSNNSGTQASADAFVQAIEHLNKQCGLNVSTNIV
jgi:hypothetical protein